jgi:hypothetical protein
MRMTDRNIARWGRDLLPRYRRVRPLVLAGALAAWAGIWVEILRPAPGKLTTLLTDQATETERDRFVGPSASGDTSHVRDRVATPGVMRQPG